MSKDDRLPALPELGRPERFYIEHVHEADRFRDHHAHEAYKVGFYIARAINYSTSWGEKLRCFLHALQHHCVAPPITTPQITEYYAQLAHLVRDQAGTEAVRVASHEDDIWAARLAAGEARAAIHADVEKFFNSMLRSTHKPPWINLAEFEALMILRNYWS